MSFTLKPTLLPVSMYMCVWFCRFKHVCFSLLCLCYMLVLVYLQQPHSSHTIHMTCYTTSTTHTRTHSHSCFLVLTDFLFLYLFWMMWSFVKSVNNSSPLSEKFEQGRYQRTLNRWERMQVEENAVISTFFFKIIVENMNMKPVSYSSILNPYEVLQ